MQARATSALNDLIRSVHVLETNGIKEADPVMYQRALDAAYSKFFLDATLAANSGTSIEGYAKPPAKLTKTKVEEWIPICWSPMNMWWFFYLQGCPTIIGYHTNHYHTTRERCNYISWLLYSHYIIHVFTFLKYYSITNINNHSPHLLFIHSIFFLPKSTNTFPTALFPVSALQILMSGFNVYRGASSGKLPSGKQILIGGGGLRMKSDPPGMNGTQYGSGWVYSNSSALPSFCVLLIGDSWENSIRFNKSNNNIDPSLETWTPPNACK